jgi:hypothetical protein
MASLSVAVLAGTKVASSDKPRVGLMVGWMVDLSVARLAALMAGRMGSWQVALLVVLREHA